MIRVTSIVCDVTYKNGVRCACSFAWIHARNKPGVPGTPAPVIIGFVLDNDAVLSADGKSSAVVVMGDVVTNYRIRCPYFKSIHRPPFPCLRIIVTGTPSTTDIACYGRRVRAGRTLYKDAAAISRPAYLVAGDEAVVPRERNPCALTNVVGDTPMAGPDLATLSDKDRPNWRPCSGHGPANIVPFDRPVLTAKGDDCPLPAFGDRTICHFPVVALATDSRRAARCVVPHVKR